MPLHKQTFWLLAVSSFMLGLAIILQQVGAASSQALQEQRQQLASAEQQLGQLRRDVVHYENTQGQLGKGTIAKHEKVSISSHFSPGELPRINDLLAHAYENDGFLLLRTFDLAWTENNTDEKEGGAVPLEAKLSITLDGEKIFTR